jgi:hypothetical protein
MHPPSPFCSVILYMCHLAEVMAGVALLDGAGGRALLLLRECRLLS